MCVYCSNLYFVSDCSDPAPLRTHTVQDPAPLRTHTVQDLGIQTVEEQA